MRHPVEEASVPAPPLRGERFDIDVLLVPARRELHRAFDQREERVIAADADVLTGVELRPALADDDIPREHVLAAETLDAEALRIGVPAVAGRAGALLGREKLQIEYEHSRKSIAQPGPGVKWLSGGANDPRLGNVLSGRRR